MLHKRVNQLRTDTQTPIGFINVNMKVGWEPRRMGRENLEVAEFCKRGARRRIAQTTNEIAANTHVPGIEALPPLVAYRNESMLGFLFQIPPEPQPMKRGFGLFTLKRLTRTRLEEDLINLGGHGAFLRITQRREIDNSNQTRSPITCYDKSAKTFRSDAMNGHLRNQRQLAKMLLERTRSHLIVIDVQAKLAPAIAGADAVIANIARLLHYAQILDVPATFTEHAPASIGRTLPTLIETLTSAHAPIAKQTFSALREPSFASRIKHFASPVRDQIVLAGMEAHVCVAQTAMDLLSDGWPVFLVVDAIGSRTTANRDTAIERLTNAGAFRVTHEMVAFEWLERGDNEAFKRVLPVLK